VFNLVGGVADHLVAGLHPVRPGQLAHDLVFLTSGAVLLAGGLVFARWSNRLVVDRDS
jgi:uncharacterized membrane protein